MEYDLHHVGIAVEDLKEALRQYEEVLGMTVRWRGSTPEGDHELVFLGEREEPQVELVSPKTEDAAVERFLRKRGPGLHHLALEVGDIEEALDRLEREGLRRIGPSPREGARGNLVAFVHPESTGGVLVELVQEVEGDEPG